MLSLPSLDDSLSSISTNSSTTLLPNNNSQYLSSNNSINDNSNIVRHQIYDYFSTKIPKSTIEMLFHLEKDERYLYFLRYGFLRRYEGKGDILYVEIPQIPKNIVIYRKPAVRNQNSEKLYLNKKDLTHIPLLEGEEYLKLLSLETNLISKIDHLISIDNLLFLNLYENRISEIENLHTVPKLKALMLGKNQITRIKNLNCLVDIEVLDLHSNKIKLIENLFSLKKLRILNLANNQLTSFVELMNNKNLEDLNLRKNLIVSIPNLTYAFDKLKKINLGKNMIAKAEFVLEFKKLKKIEELYLEGNPVIYIKDAYKKFFNLPLKFKDAAQFQIYKNNSLNNNNNENNNANGLKNSNSKLNNSNSNGNGGLSSSNKDSNQKNEKQNIPDKSDNKKESMTTKSNIINAGNFNNDKIKSGNSTMSSMDVNSKIKQSMKNDSSKNNNYNNTNYNYNNNSLNHKKEGNSTENPENL